jgi:ribonucleoside-diphosphate reductase alpha chain
MEHIIAKEKGWKVGVDYPEWGNNELYLQTIQGGYLKGDETPKEAYRRVSNAAAKHFHKHNVQELSNKFFDIIWKGWLCLSTPVLSNMGLERGLPISCFSSYYPDDLYEINRKNTEISMLSKNGGGTSANFSEVRPAGAKISSGGTSDGIIPFLKQLDSTVKASKQLPVRRGACAVYLDIEHKDYEDFLLIRKGQGDPDRQQMRLHQGSVITDEFMNQMITGDEDKRKLWTETLRWRIERGEPYIAFIDNANKTWYSQNKSIPSIKSSNLCNEIWLPLDKDHSFVCCLSSLNLYKWDEFKDTDTIQLSIWFLDAVIEEFIQKAEQIKGIEDAVRFAKKSRAIGLGKNNAQYKLL